MRVVRESNAKAVNARIRLCSPEEREWLSEQMRMLQEADVVYPNNRAIL